MPTELPAITQAIAQYVYDTQIEDFREETIQAAKAAIIDSLACMLAGSLEPLAKILCQYIEEEGGHPTASVIGKKIKTTTTNAALVNGAIGHALDYDDITEVTKTHPTVVLLPAVLALAEENMSSGRDLLLAYLVGFEVACSIGVGMSPAYFDELGWHPTGPLGTVGASAGASKILRMSKDKVAMTVSLAASQGAGLRQNFGTMTKPFHAGNAARCGVSAARLINLGFTAGSDTIEGPFGFMNAFSGGSNFSPEAVIASLQSTCHMDESGIEIKKYPCCGSAHLSLDALLNLVSTRSIDPAEIDKVSVLVDFDPPRSLIHSNPSTPLEGKFSMEYCLASAIVDKHVGLNTFTSDKFDRTTVQSLMPKIGMERIPGNEGKPSWMEGFHEVHLSLKNGEQFSNRASRTRRGSLRGVTFSEVVSKFQDCASLVIDEGSLPELIDSLVNLEKVTDINQVTSRMSP